MARRTVVVPPAKGGRGPRRPPEPPKASVRERADELVRNGMPFQMAMSVARGRITLNEALERMARGDRVERMMREHDLSRALAMQIALGQASLDQVLAKRRMADHREHNRERSCLVDAHESGLALTVGLAGGATAKGKVAELDAYTFALVDGDKRVEVHKLQAVYAYASADWKKAKKALRVDKDVAARKLSPAVRPQDRYNCSDKRLFRYVDEDVEIQAVLLDGTVVHGRVAWFSRYEFAIRVKDVDVIVFRHALVGVGSV